MACSGHRRTPKTPTASYPTFGEKGMMLLEYVGEDEPETLYGEVTNAAYPFDESSVRYVDVRDATYFLGKDFVEIE